jgi:hypothetical protein
VNNRFLLLKCITLGALSLPTPFFIYFFLSGVDFNQMTYLQKFVIVTILLHGGALIGLASFYKDTAVAALKDWYPSEKT